MAVLITDEMVAAYKDAWHQADREGDVGNRVLRGLEAVVEFNRSEIAKLRIDLAAAHGIIWSQEDLVAEANEDIRYLQEQVGSMVSDAWKTGYKSGLNQPRAEERDEQGT